MRNRAACACLLAAFVGCNGSNPSDPIAEGPGTTSIGTDWDDGTAPGSFKFLAGFAASPGQIIEIDVVNATTAAQAQTQIADGWDAQLPSYPVERCGTDILIFPSGTVGSMVVLDSDNSWDRIISTTTTIPLANGLQVKKVVGACPY